MLRTIVSANTRWKVVAEASSGMEAVTQMVHEPDVVLMDVVMPVMDGLEATRRIKQLAPDTIVILTTAYQDAEFQARSMLAGADGFVRKDELVAEAIQRVLETRGGEEHG